MVVEAINRGPREQIDTKNSPTDEWDQPTAKGHAKGEQLKKVGGQLGPCKYHT